MLRYNKNNSKQEKRTLVVSPNSMYMFTDKFQYHWKKAPITPPSPLYDVDECARFQWATMINPNRTGPSEKERFNGLIFPLGFKDGASLDPVYDGWEPLQHVIWLWSFNDGNFEDRFYHDGDPIFGYREISTVAHRYGMNHYVLLFLTHFVSHYARIKNLYLPLVDSDILNILTEVAFYDMTVNDLLLQLRRVADGVAFSPSAMIPALTFPMTDPLYNFIPKGPNAYCQFKTILLLHENIAKSIIPDELEYPTLIYYAFQVSQQLGGGSIAKVLENTARNNKDPEADPNDNWVERLANDLLRKSEIEAEKNQAGMRTVSVLGNPRIYAPFE